MKTVACSWAWPTKGVPSFVAFCGWLLTVLPASAQSEADQVAQEIRGVMDEALVRLQADSTGRQAQELVNRRRLINRLQTYAYGRPSMPLSENSPERELRVRQIEGWLAEHEPTLAEMIRASAPHSSVPNTAVRLSEFAKPSEPLRAALVETATSPTSDYQKAAEAYNAIFKLGADDAKIRPGVTQAIREGLANPRSRENSLAEMLLQYSPGWACPEFEPLYSELLAIPFPEGEYDGYGGKVRILSHYRAAAKGMAALDVKTPAVEALIEQRLAEIAKAEPSGDGNLAMEGLTFALAVLRGAEFPPPAINIKGQKLGAQVAPSGGVTPTERVAVEDVRVAKEMTPKKEVYAGINSLSSTSPDAREAPRTNLIYWLGTGALLCGLLIWFTRRML